MDNEKRKASKRLWFQKNKELIYARRKKFLQENPEALLTQRERDKEWHTKYRTKSGMYKARRT